jgi:addiction module HigA family antidote
MPMPTAHPGQILVAELLERDWTLTELAAKLEVDRLFLADFLNTHADLTPELANKIAALIGTTPEFWLNLQSNFDAAVAAAHNAGRFSADVA